MILSGQSVISRVYMSLFGNGYGSLGTSTEVVLKKVPDTRYCTQWKPKVNRTELYRAIPCSGKEPFVNALCVYCPSQKTKVSEVL